MPKPAQPSLLPARELRMARWTEADFQRELEKQFTSHQWLVMHVRRLQGRDGRWLTGTSVPDYPDLTAVHLTAGVAMILELKAGKGRASPGQQRWVRAFDAVAGVVAMVVYPADYDRLAELIREPARIHQLQAPGS